MGRRGPAPKPTQLRILEGKAGHRPLNDREPVYPVEVPPRPSFLDAVARTEWKRVVPALERLGLLTSVDRAALAAYCQAYSRWRKAEIEIQKHGLTSVTPLGFVQKRPEVTIAKEAMALMRAFAAEFGMTPSSRSRVKTGTAAPDPLEGFLARGKKQKP